MKRTLFHLLMLLCISIQVFAHDFEAVNSDGKTIYYNITSSIEPRTVAVTYQGSVYSSYSNEYTGVINIPENVTYNGYTYSVTSIGISAFNDCINLTSATIPNSVISIGNWTFGGCSGLTSITIPNSVTSIGNSAFEECSSLTSVTIGSSVTSIGNSAFEGCSSLTTLNWNAKNCISVGFPATSSAFYNLTSLTQVNIGDSVEVIPPYFLYGCSGLTGIVIPNRVTSVGDYAFSGCSDLTSLSMGNSVISIGSDAFKYCSGLTSITIPNSVTSIGEYAFYRCSGLTSVTIGNSVTSIGGYAFSECSSLTEITCNANTAPSLNFLNPFSGVNTQIPVYIPYGSSMSYSSNWSYFSNFIEGDLEYSLSAQSNDTSMGSVTILTQPTCSSPQAVIKAVANEGCRFDHWSDGTASNPYTFTLTQDTIISAYFAFQAYDTIIIRDTIETFVPVHDTITLYDTITIENTDTIYITETPCARVSTYIYATINPGEIYSMNGFNEVSSGVYTHNFETYDGCDSTVTLILSVNSSLENISRDVTLKLYPNPTQDNVVLNLDGIEKDSRIFLTDIQGRRIREYILKAEEKTLRIDMQDLERGAYYLRIVSDNFQRTEKIIKK